MSFIYESTGWVLQDLAANRARSRMFVADRDSLLRVVYVIIRDGLPPPGLGAYQCGSKAAAFRPKASSPAKID